uniref:Putative conserved plasma membrane protein n=1 Tax=Nyssomyia neivai TaxID=330878 RepID=A0A1L8DA82_9DIPT
MGISWRNQRFITTSKDLETGEIETHTVPQTPDLFDQETGELNAIAFRKTKFNIPRACLQQYDDPARNDVYTLTNKERVIHLKEEIILGYNKTSHRMFLIPSLFFFFKLTAIFIIFIETLLHIWAHRRNARNTNPGIYFRSPMHVVSSQFCAICRSESSMKRVKMIQDERIRIRRLHQFDFVTRTLT